MSKVQGGCSLKRQNDGRFIFVGNAAERNQFIRSFFPKHEETDLFNRARAIAVSREDGSVESIEVAVKELKSAEPHLRYVDFPLGSAVKVSGPRA